MLLDSLVPVIDAVILDVCCVLVDSLVPVIGAVILVSVVCW